MTLSRLREFLSRILRSRHGGILIFITSFVAVATSCRIALFLRSFDSIAADITLPTSFFAGFLFDLAIAFFFAVPFAILTTLVPARCFTARIFRVIFHIIFAVTLGIFLFGIVSEWIFWSEFFVRFNFIAVDYLIYTTEVINNINESYNMPLILGGLAIGTLSLYVILLRPLVTKWLDGAARENTGRWRGLLAVLAPNAGAFLAFLAIGVTERSASTNSMETLSQGLRHMASFQPSFPNSFNSEIAKNGQYALLASFWSNQLSYDKFYPLLPSEETYTRLRQLLQEDNSVFLSSAPRDITRQINGASNHRRLNVIQITVESLSAEYLGCYKKLPHSLEALTPNLDKLARESLWFKNFYATGTRTVRGMEALILSIPPTPGQSVLRRPNNENLFTLGSVFQARNYDTAFIYGGSGFFDNMNYFFANNGFRVVDRPVKIETDKPKITFENAWGVCDEDLLDWTLTEADRAHAAGKNFYHFVMTTSNHRPYTWPENRINLPQGTRKGAVKYTDHAIGRFLARARTRPWFNDTVFVIVADHCASVAGKRELEVTKYEIPLFIYAPAHIRARTVETLSSQIDYAPTLLGILGWSYRSKFFGRDILRAPSPDKPPRAFISNYQKIALLENDSLALLKPVAATRGYDCDRVNGALASSETSKKRIIHDTIAYYQCASELLSTGRQNNIADPENNRLSVDMARRTSPAAPDSRTDAF